MAVEDALQRLLAATGPLTEQEHYPGMTERAIDAMIDEAARRFDIRGVRVIHRVGPLQPQGHIEPVAVTSAHRGQAFFRPASF